MRNSFFVFLTLFLFTPQVDANDIYNSGFGVRDLVFGRNPNTEHRIPNTEHRAPITDIKGENNPPTPFIKGESLRLGVHSSADLNSMRNAIKLIESQGGRIVHIFPPHILIGAFPSNIQAKDVGLRNIYQGVIAPSDVADLGEETIFAVLVWNRRFEEPSKATRLEVEPEPIKNDCFIRPPKKSLSERPFKTQPYGASFYETSEYLIGKVAVGIILPESNGGSENWEESEETKVVSEIMAACDWWSNKEPTAYLSFTYKIHKKVPSQYEPITLKQSDEKLWIKETINSVHPDSYTNYLDKVTNYDNYLRDTYQSHWAFTIFVVDSSNDSDGMFADGKYFAYAYLGGPLMVMTYKNDGYGIDNMDAVCAHEIGHIFYALDEYKGFSSPNDYSGYLKIVNGNHIEGGIINVSCIMRGQISPYTQGAVCTYTRQQLGWRDTDGDNKLDIVDIEPSSSLKIYTPDPTTDDTPTYTGNVVIQPYPNNNPKGHGNDITINSIFNVEYRINGGGWQNAIPTDGVFDEAVEDFNFTTSPLAPGTYLFEVRATNLCGTQTVLNIEQSPYASDTLIITGTSPPIGSQTITGSVLKISVFDDGAMGIWKKDGTNWISQVYGGDSKGSVLFLAGTNTHYRYASKANTFDCTPIRFTAFSNTMPGSFTIITEYKAGETGVMIKQITTYLDGAEYYKMEWQMTNHGTITYNDVRFFHGEDTYFTGTDKGYGHWNNSLNMVYVISELPTKTGIMGLYGWGLTPATSYYEDEFWKVTDQAKTGFLPNTVNGNLHDAAYVLGWQRTALAPGQTWQVVAYERISSGSGVIVLAPAEQESPPENTLTYYFNVYNNEKVAHIFNLFANSSHRWQVQIRDIADAPISSVSLAAGTSRTIKLVLTVPATAKAGTLDSLSLTAVSQTDPKIAGTATTITTIIPAPLHHIKINPAAAAVVVTQTKNFTAQGYDKYDNLIPDLIFTWTSNIGTLTSQVGSRTSFTAGITVSSGTINAFVGSITGIAVIEVIPGPVDYIQISPDSATLEVGEPKRFYAQGYDKYHNLIPNLTYNWAVINHIGHLSPTIGTSTLFTATITPTVGEIIVSSNGKNAFASITITLGQLHHINILPATQTVSVLGSCRFWAQGYDRFNNPIPNLTYQWQVNHLIGTITPEIGSLTIFTAGTKALIGTLSVTSGSITSNAVITITAGALERLIITPPVATVTVSTSQVFNVIGRDHYNNLITNLNYLWHLSPDLGTITPTIGSTITFTAGTLAITGKLLVNCGTITQQATITLVPCKLHHLIITPPETVMVIKESQEFSVKGYDKFNNFIPELQYSWSSNSGTTIPFTGSKTTFTAGTIIGIGTLSASVGTITQIATITIISNPLHHLVITPSLATITVNHRLEFKVVAYDKFNNPIENLTYRWQVDKIGSVYPTYGSATIFTASTKVQVGTITAIVGTISVMATITLLPDTLDHLDITPPIATISVTTQQEFYVTGYDKYDNYISNLDYLWQINPAGLGWITPSVGTKTIFTAGTISQRGILTVTSGSVTQMAAITVIPLELQYLVITPSVATLTVNSSQKFKVQGYDQFSNLMSDLDYFWQVDKGNVYPTYGSMTTFTAGTKAGTATLTVTSRGIKQNAGITITPETLWRLEVVPSSLTIPINKQGTFTARGYDRYDNLIPNIICNWDVLPLELGNLYPTTGISATFTPNFRVTTGIIKATSNGIIGTAAIWLSAGELDHFDFESISHQVGSLPFPATITARDVYNNLVDFTGQISLSVTHGDIIANGKFEAGIWTGTITINGLGLDMVITGSYGNARGTSNPFASLIDDNYGTITTGTNTILSINPESLKGRNYYVMIDTNPKNSSIDIANFKDDQEPQFDRVLNSIREIKIVDGDNNPLDYEFGNTTILTIPYQDNNQDGIIDGTNILEKSLKMFILVDNRWQAVSSVPTIDPIDNRIISPIFKSGTYILMGYSIQPNLNNVKVYPVPFKPARGDREIVFEGLANNSTIRIYDVAGSLRFFVEELAGYWNWDVRDNYGQPLESGVYIYIVTDTEKNKQIGKIVIIR